VALSGSISVLLQFDVCEEIRLNDLRNRLQADTLRLPKLKHPAPDYIRYQRPPVVEPLEPLILESGESLEGQLKYYDYGVMSVVLELPFAGEWEDLIHLASRWVWDVDFAARVEEILRRKLSSIAPFLVKPYSNWLSEDYFIFHLRAMPEAPAAEELVSRYGANIAQLVRGDTALLSRAELNEVMQSSISYYATDLAVIGWNAAFLYDSVAGAATTIQLLEYANSQLLEFRHYDELLSRELDRVYSLRDSGTGVWARWRLARSATQLQTMLLDVAEITERADNAIKFLSDMFAARLYKLAASRIGVPDYKDLVTEKVQTAEDLYRFMVDQFNHGRAFVLESAVLVILLIELFFLFRGKGF
jgi:hypothetical protein